ncbi:MAG: hypothetical protein RBT75_09640 [Anaerolineae bacterium]|nr:hypothetical protein [Anaerolineae bacterium]
MLKGIVNRNRIEFHPFGCILSSMDKADLYSTFNRKAPATPAEALRVLLETLEQRVGSLARADTAAALEIPALFDQAAALLAQLQARGVELPAEQGRFESLSAQYRGKAALFLKRIGGAAVLAEQRAARQPEPAAWWWSVDLALAAQRKAALRRQLRWASGALALLALAGLIYTRFFAPTPVERALYRYQFTAADLAGAGEVAAALEQVEQALALDPGNPEFLTMKGVFLEALADPAAEAAHRAAEQAHGDSESYLIMRGQLEVQLERWEAVQGTAEALLATRADSAFAYLYRGMAEEALGNPAQARADYERAGELAQAQQLHEIYVTARTLLANSMQSGPW